MRWSQPGPQQLQILFTPAELSQLQREQDGTHPPQIRPFLQLLFLQAGLAPDVQLAVQLYGDGQDGCLLLVRPLRPDPAPQLPLLWQARDIDRLIVGAAHTFGRSAHRLRRSDLYRTQDGWWLALWPFDPADPLIPLLWDEYAARRQGGALAAAWLAEHGERAAAGDALGLLYAYFG